LPDHRLATEAEGPAECVIDEGDAVFGIPADDDIALMIEEIAITRFALAHLLLQVLQ
jgi:hypothetical protein